MIFLGRLTKLKKVDLLIEALAILNKKSVGYELKIVGDGAEVEYLLKLVKIYKAENYIHFKGET